MRSWLRWTVGVAAALLVLLVGVGLVLYRWVGSDDFRSRVEREASAAIGVPLQLGGLSVDWWPLPAVAASDIRVQSKPPLTLERIEARPGFEALLRGRLQISTLVVRNAVLPQPAIAALAAGMDKRDKAAARKPPAAPPADPGDPLALLPRRMLLEHVTWIDTQGQRTTVDAQAKMADDGLPESFGFTILEGKFSGARGELRREAEHWPVRVAIGGGRVDGKLQLQPGPKGGRVLSGQLHTENVELSALTAPSRTLTGKLQAQTTLRAEFTDPALLADVMRTQTTFNVKDAVVHGIDLAQAVKTIGLNRGGETRLDTLAGQVSTHGRAVQLSNLVATSGALSATGNVAIAPSKALSGHVNVDLAGSQGALGVPLLVGGTLDSPSVTLTRGALVGAAVGSVIAPGVGTGAGAKLGDKLGEGLKGLFGK